MSDYHEPDISDRLQIGACRYCGQIMNIQLLGIVTKTEADDYASMHCSCDDSKRFRDTEQTKERRRKEREQTLHRAKEEIENLCGEEVQKIGLKPIIEEIKQMMPYAAEMIYDDKMKDITFGVSPTVKVKITKSAKGIIEIKRSNTSTLKREV